MVVEFQLIVAITELRSGYCPLRKRGLLPWPPPAFCRYQHGCLGLSAGTPGGLGIEELPLLRIDRDLDIFLKILFRKCLQLSEKFQKQYIELCILFTQIHTFTLCLSLYMLFFHFVLKHWRVSRLYADPLLPGTKAPPPMATVLLLDMLF